MSESTTPTPISDYNGSNIRSLSGLQAVRLRPKFYLGSVETAGLTHLAKEVFDNSVDELGLNPLHASLCITMCRDMEKGTFQIIVRDTGRGMPIDGVEKDGSYKFVNLMTKLHTSGKFDVDAYETSAGQFGVGIKATAGCSFHFRLISHRPEGSASLTLLRGEHPDVPTYDMTPNAVTGVTAAFEPDPEIFVGISDYGDNGYIGIITLLRQYVFFTRYNIQFRMINQPLPEELWSGLSIKEADACLLQYEQNAMVVWDAATNDPNSWIKDYWNLSRNFSWHTDIRMSPEEKLSGEYGNLKDVILKLYYVKHDRNGGCFAMVNNVPINNWGSDHLACIVATMKDAIAPYIEDLAMRKFFLQVYKIPLFVAVSVKYSGAEFGNAVKDRFNDHVFREIYTKLLTTWFKCSSAGTALISEYHKLIADDIHTRYMESLGDKMKTSDTRRLWARLNHRDRFTDCGATKDRHLCELFLMEGESAGGSSNYDTEHQALYTLGGKPLNAIKGTGGNRNEILKKVFDDKILSDILTIINYDPRNPDLTKLNYGAVLLSTDAD